MGRDSFSDFLDEAWPTSLTALTISLERHHTLDAFINTSPGLAKTRLVKAVENTVNAESCGRQGAISEGHFHVMNLGQHIFLEANQHHPVVSLPGFVHSASAIEAYICISSLNIYLLS